MAIFHRQCEFCQRGRSHKHNIHSRQSYPDHLLPGGGNERQLRQCKNRQRGCYRNACFGSRFHQRGCNRMLRRQQHYAYLKWLHRIHSVAVIYGQHQLFRHLWGCQCYLYGDQSDPDHLLPRGSDQRQLHQRHLLQRGHYSRPGRFSRGHQRSCYCLPRNQQYHPYALRVFRQHPVAVFQRQCEFRQYYRSC